MVCGGKNPAAFYEKAVKVGEKPRKNGRNPLNFGPNT
jgi:hypothetical protein